MFAAIKKVVLMQQNALNLSILQAINNMLQHEELVQTFLDSDLAELIYDALCSSSDCQLIAWANTVVIYSLKKVIFNANIWIFSL